MTRVQKGEISEPERAYVGIYVDLVCMSALKALCGAHDSAQAHMRVT